MEEKRSMTDFAKRSLEREATIISFRSSRNSSKSVETKNTMYVEPIPTTMSTSPMTFFTSQTLVSTNSRWNRSSVIHGNHMRSLRRTSLRFTTSTRFSPRKCSNARKKAMALPSTITCLTSQKALAFKREFPAAAQEPNISLSHHGASSSLAISSSGMKNTAWETSGMESQNQRHNANLKRTTATRNRNARTAGRNSTAVAVALPTRCTQPAPSMEPTTLVVTSSARESNVP